MGQPTFTQVTFRTRDDDGDETGATWRQAQGDNDTWTVDTNYRIRFLIDEQAVKGWTGVVFSVYYNHNGGGWNEITGTSPIQWAATDPGSNYTDGDDCTEQLTGGTGTFITDNNGMQSNSNDCTNDGTSGYYFECEYCLTIDSVQVANNDTIVLRVYDNDTELNTYTDEPTITVYELSTLSVNKAESITVGESGIDPDVGVTASKAESVTVADTPQYYPDEIIVTDSVTVELVSVDFSPSVSDGVAVGDTPSVTLPDALQVSVSDGVTIGDVPDVAIATLQISVSDGVTVGDTDAETIVSEISVSDSITAADDPTVDLRAAWYNPDSIQINVGSIVSGDIEDTWSDNGVRLQLAETTGTPGFSYDFYFYNVPATAYSITVNGYYQGNPAHNIKIQQYNFTTTGWTNLTAASNDFPSDTSDQDYTFSILGGVNYVQSGEVRIRIVHESAGNINHYFYIDEMVMGQIPVVHVDDGVTVTDTPTAAMAALNINVSENIGAADAPTVNVAGLETREVDVNDGVTAADTLIATMDVLAVSVFEEATIGESVGAAVSNPQASTSDSVTAGEDVTVNVEGLETCEVSAADSVTAAENVSATIGDLEVNADDTVTASENVTVSVPEIGTLVVSVSENVTVANVPVVSISVLTISVSDNITAGDSVNVSIAIYVIASDTANIIENVDAVVGSPQVFTSENIIVGDSGSMTLPGVILSVVATENVTLAEAILMTIIRQRIFMSARESSPYSYVLSDTEINSMALSEEVITTVEIRDD